MLAIENLSMLGTRRFCFRPIFGTPGALAHFVIEANRSIRDFSAFKVPSGDRLGDKSPSDDARRCLIYCSNGQFSSRRIERARYRGALLHAANVHRAHHGRRSLDLSARQPGRRLARVSCRFCCWIKELKLVKVGLVSVDGSKFEGRLRASTAVTYGGRASNRSAQAGRLADLMKRVAAADGEGDDDPQALPKEIREAFR